jgi:ankyrin repeat protein
MTPLLIAFYNLYNLYDIHDHHEEVIKLVTTLLKHNANIAARVPNTDNTVLHVAAETCNSDIIKILIEHGADVTAVNMQDMTAYDIALPHWKDQSEVLELLKPNMDKIVLDDDEKYLEELEERFKCSECSKSEMKIVLFCGHIVCVDCSFKIVSCKRCSKPIENRLTLFV